MKITQYMSFYCPRPIFMGFVIGFLLNIPANAGSGFLRPVDGRNGGWNAVWARLSNATRVPNTRDLVAAMVEEPFQGAWLIRIKKTESNTALVILTSCDSSDQDSRIAQSTKAFPVDLSTELNTLWISALLQTRYSEKVDPIVFDGTSAVFGATSNDRPYYMMGTCNFDTESSLQWMLKCSQLLKTYIKAKTVSDETLIIQEVKKMLSTLKD